jgi:HEXXH motif-containing protein
MTRENALGPDDDLLWHDPGVFERRREKSACALIALAGSLERDRPLAGGEDEFLALFRAVAALDPAVFTRVWTDPAAYFWTRVAYQLAATRLCGAEASPLVRAYAAELGIAEGEALPRALDDFKRFALAAHFLAGRDLRFAAPFEAGLPLAIPGTRLALEGEGAARIAGLERGVLVLAGGARLPLAAGASAGPAGPRVAEAIALDAGGGAEVLLAPPVFHLPGVDFKGPLLAAGSAYQAEHAPLVARSLALIARHAPAAHEQVRAGLRVIALKPRRAGDYSNLTFSHLPGALAVSVIPEPHELADSIVHEVHHDRLFALEEIAPFFDGAGAREAMECRHYSPWRSDPRALHGIFHGLFVYCAVARFWLGVLREGASAPALSDYVRDRVVRHPLQLEIGARAIARRARLTEHGERIFAGIEREIAALAREARAAGAPHDAPALTCEDDGSFRRLGPSVREDVREHARARGEAVLEGEAAP